MKREQILALVVVAFILAACAGQTSTPIPASAPAPVKPTQSKASASTAPTVVPADTQPAAAAATVSFSKDVKPILDNSCANCHGVEQVRKGLDVRTYESLMAGSDNGPVIVAGKSADSFLFEQVANGKMPKRGPKLTPDQLKIISSWIDAGAQNN
jgi:mono/diheme cytochrome c family protein